MVHTNVSNAASGVASPASTSAAFGMYLEMGRLVKIATPTIDAVLALVQERGRQAGLYSNDITPVDGSDEGSDYRLD